MTSAATSLATDSIAVHDAHVHTLPVWQSHQRVRAVKIKSLVDMDGRKYKYLLTPVDQSIPPFEVERIFFHKHSPEAGGYYVVHEDGYKIAMTAQEFEAGFSPCAKPPVKTPELVEVTSEYKVIPLDEQTRLQMALVLLTSGSPAQQLSSLEHLNNYIEKAKRGLVNFSS